MKAINSRIAAGTAAGLALACFSASAHRLDEYLQATRIAIAPDRIVLEIDLSPGIDLASMIFTAIDTDQDGKVSGSEARAYANEVVKDLVFAVDGHPEKLTVARTDFPAYEEMLAGTGRIQIEAEVSCASAVGGHSLFYRNDHRREISVYLVNALAPATNRVEISRQTRDSLQRQSRVDFIVKQ